MIQTVLPVGVKNLKRSDEIVTWPRKFGKPLEWLLPPRPLLMLHGTADAVVPPDGVIALEEKLRPLYASSPERLKLQLYPGLGHDYPDEMLTRTCAWFERFLLGDN